jgi:para-nitrobenzyl esterase
VRRLCLAVLVLVALPVFALPAFAGDASTVRTTAGLVRGVVDGGFRSYLGIPFAAPPVGGLRWVAPQPVRPWAGVRDASEPGFACMQAGAPAADISEDCLYLNVTAPKSITARRLPVMVWVHGGGFFEGTGATFDPRRMVAAGNVIVVTINYRLGIFGLFDHPDFGAGGGDFALLDQQAALRWVRQNIARFGGDAGNVTLFGVSAGGMSTCSQLVSPGAAGLFDKAIISSGSCAMNWPKNVFYPGTPQLAPWMSRAAARSIGTGDAGKLTCVTAVLSCLRGKSKEALLPYLADFARVPYGTAALPENPATAVRAGRFLRMPVMQGNTRDEHSSWIAALDMEKKIDGPRYRSMLKDIFGSVAGAVEARYPARAYVSPAAALSAVLTDRSWVCPALTADRDFARRTVTYAYEFGDRTAPPIAPFPPDLPPGASHGSDVIYLADADGTTSSVLNPSQLRLSSQMTGYWTRFAATGNPNGAGLPHWARFGSERTVQSLVPGQVGAIDLSAEHLCRFWS